MTAKFYIPVLAACLAGCSATETPPSMTNHGAVAVEHPDQRPLDTVPEWLASAGESTALSCYLDAVEAARPRAAGWEADAGAVIRVAGWAVETRTRVQREAKIGLRPLAGSGQVAYFAADRSERADVTAAPAFAENPPANAGLTGTLQLDGIVPGEYEFVYVVGDAQNAARCNLGATRSLVVR